MASLPQTYKAAVIKSVRAPLEIVDQELKKPSPGQVLVKVLACGVCHSDVVVQEGGFGDGLFPRVPGHEIIGDVVAVGDDVTRFQGGERVGGAWHGGHDGTCTQCQKGFFQTCQNTAVNGVSMDGGYAEYVLLRAEAVVRVPKNMDPADSAPLLCAGVTVFNSIRKQGIEHGSLVVIQGLGGLGHLGVQYANKMGYKVAVLSSDSSKKEFATKLGAHEYIDTSAEDPVKRLQELGGAALIVATAPHAKAISPLTGGLMPGGKLLVLAPVGKLEVDSVDLIIGGKSVGGWPSGHQIDTEAALDFAATHGVKCMVEKFPLTEARKASEHMISNTRTPQDIWFISGVSLAVLPWPDDPLKSKALFLNPIHARRLGGKYDKPPKGADETKDFHYRKRTIWINLVVLFRLLLMAQHLSFDHDNFWKFVRLNWGIGTNVSDIKFIVNLYADRRDAYLNNRHIQRRHEDLLTDLIDAWATRGGDLPLPRWPRRDDITAEWERLYADWDRFLQHGDYFLLIDPDDPPTLGRFPEDRGTPAPFRIKGEGLRSRSQSTGYDRDQSSTRTSMAPPPRNNDPQPPPSPPSRPLTPHAMEVTVDELIESEGNPAQKRKPHPGELDPTPTKRPLSFLKTKVSEHEKKLKSPQSHGNVGEQATMPGPSKANTHAEALQSLQEDAVDGNLGRLSSMEETVAQLTKNSTTKLNEHMNILNSLRASSARLDKTSVESKATLDSLQAKVDRQSEQSQTVVKTIDSLRKMNDVFNAMLDSLEAKVDHQSEQSQVVAKAVDSLKGTNDEFNTKVESLETDFGKYRDQFHTLKTVVDSLEKTTSESANVKTLEAKFGEHKDELHTLQKAVGDFDKTTVEHDENIRALQEQMKLFQESGDLSRDVHKAHNDLTVFTASQCQTALEKLDTFAADLSSLRKEVESCRQTTDEAREWQTQREEANKTRASLLDIESMAARRKEQREQLDRDHKLDTRIKIADDRISRVDASAKVTTKTLKGIQYRQQEFAEEVDDRLATTGKHLASVMARVELLRNSMDESMSARLSKLESGLKSQSITSPAVEERLARMEDAIQTNTTLIGNCRTLVEVSKTSLDQQFSTLSNRVSLLEQRLNRRMAEQEQSAKAQAMRMDRLEAALAQQMGTNSQFRG
ncbi:hypothetical protein KHU50_008884 [Colletotrichum sp. SAR 10_65]|nr:hypothetical protein KHU50_008884 [Colletotrichum sp. SAR 10_65]KAI8211513.1 hypothetical protein K4K52_010218 [Colletotrichum sp. SAR 10_76]